MIKNKTRRASIPKKMELLSLPIAYQTSNTFNEYAEITVLSFGGGQDSTCILYKIIYDPAFRARFVRGHLIVVMSDTGDEHRYTYDYSGHIKEVCVKAGIEFYLITAVMNFHTESWQSLRHQMRTNSTIFGMEPILTLVVAPAFARKGSCTDNLKIKPIYRFLADYIHRRYNFAGMGIPLKNKWGDFNNADTFNYFALRYGKINMLIGIARKEEGRVNNTASSRWQQRSISKVYPLLEIGYDRADCQAYIRQVNKNV